MLGFHRLCRAEIPAYFPLSERLERDTIHRTPGGLSPSVLTLLERDRKQVDLSRIDRIPIKQDRKVDRQIIQPVISPSPLIAAHLFTRQEWKASAKRRPGQIAGTYDSTEIPVEMTEPRRGRPARGIHHARRIPEPFEPSAGKTRDIAA